MVFRRLAIGLLLLLLVAGSASAQGTHDRKRAIDSRISGLKGKLDEVNRQEGVLTSEISAVTSKIRALEHDVGSTVARLTRLEQQLAHQRVRLAKLGELHRLQTRKLRFLEREHATAQERLEERLVAIYESESVHPVEVVLAAANFRELLDQLDYLNQLGTQDRRVAQQVAVSKRNVREARKRTAATRARVQQAANEIEARARVQRAERDRLLASRRALADARSEKQRTLASVQTNERELKHEIVGLEQASASLAAQIRAAQAAAAARAAAAAQAAAARASESPGVVESDGSSAATPVSSSPPTSASSSGGMIWPVSGPVTSGFGPRWGRMHEGIDISASTGTPIRAAKSGTVIFSGSMSGYGNLVVVDHGGGLATAYAHLSGFATGAGRHVSQGQVIGYVGCTGRCFGSHLHFEVRVGGRAVNPLGYL
jgi:murein DD-endopeptidase MepM/ murein hydrolase activator NlpD